MIALDRILASFTAWEIKRGVEWVPPDTPPSSSVKCFETLSYREKLFDVEGNRYDY
jgi:hypothetical protein